MNLPKFSTGIRWRVVLSVLVLLAILAGVPTTYTKFTELQEDNATLSTKLEKQTETLDKLLVDNNNLTENVKNLDKSYKKAIEENRQVTEEKVKLSNSVKQLEESNKQLHIDLANAKKEYAKLKLDIEKAEKQKMAKTTTANSYTSVSRGTSSSSKKIMVSATAYTAYCNGCSGITATGINLRENPDAKVIAVDPRVIPLGTKVYVEGYGYAIAGDTGGAIKGNKVDLFMNSTSQAYSWGRRTVALTILE